MVIGRDFGIKQRLIRFLCERDPTCWVKGSLPSMLCNARINKEFKTECYDSTYHGKIDNRADWSVYLFGEGDACRNAFACKMAMFLKYRSGKPFVCYDVGAGRGDFCLAFAGVADDVVAFERSSSRFSDLIRNTPSGKNTTIKAFNLELSDVDQTNPPPLVNGATPDIDYSVSDQERRQSSSPFVELVRGDHFVERSGLRLPNLIRINAGNNYRSILRGFESILDLSQPIVLVEQSASTNDRHIDETDLRSVLYEHVELRSLSGSPYRPEFLLKKFDPQALRIVCYHKNVHRMVEQELCKMRSLKMGAIRS